MTVEWLQYGALGLSKHHEKPIAPWEFYTYIGVSIALVCMAGLMSGLTLGLMSLDEIDLEVLKRSGTEDEKRHAKRIMPVIANEHLLLVTLLLFNALSTEALPIFLDRLVDPITAVVLSVTVVLVVGEILPQAVCKSYGLQVGSYASWLVRLLMVLSVPITWPIAKVLDCVLGSEHSGFFRRAQLKALVGLHATDEGLGGNLTPDEISIITGALDLTSKTAWAAMTPINKVFMLPADRPLNEATLQDILISGHSRVPVHESGNRHKLLGLILVKELVLVDPDEGRIAGQLVSRSLPLLPADTPLYQLLRLFEAGGSHMVALTKPPPRAPQGPTATMSDKSQQPHGQQGLVDDGDKTPVGTKAGVINIGEHAIYIESQQKSPRGLGGHGIPAVLNPAVVGAEPGQDAWGFGKEGDPVGIITIEDVIEELLQQEIIDETDLYVDNMQITRVDAQSLTNSLPPRLRKAYGQQFMPRVGRLVAHHNHVHHPHHHITTQQHLRRELSNDSSPNLATTAAAAAGLGDSSNTMQANQAHHPSSSITVGRLQQQQQLVEHWQHEGLHHENLHQEGLHHEIVGASGTRFRIADLGLADADNLSPGEGGLKQPLLTKGDTEN